MAGRVEVVVKKAHCLRLEHRLRRGERGTKGGRGVGLVWSLVFWVSVQRALLSTGREGDEGEEAKLGGRRAPLPPAAAALPHPDVALRAGAHDIAEERVAVEAVEQV